VKNKKPFPNSSATHERKPLRKKPKSATQTPEITQALLADKPTNAATTGVRIQKLLAQGGLGSRREIERWMEEGRVKVNGVQATLGTRLRAGDYLQINERGVDWEKFSGQTSRVLLYHKPTGEIVTRSDPQGRPVIFSRLPELAVGRWIAVGRLDINTSGLLLVTNNGELANRLMHPSSEVEREYAVRILGDVPEQTLASLQQGVELEDGLAKFKEIHFNGGEGANKWYYVIVSEGRNRLVRRLWESQNVVVSRLMRVRYGPVVLPEYLPAGKHYELAESELDLLFEFAGMTKEKPATATVKPEARSSKSFNLRKSR
jgi:23S rRNA pseudouridine2605 synthase